jgi:hypothetical protein
MSQNVSLCLTSADAKCEQNPRPEPPDEISDRQRAALEMIASGANDTAVASSVGVSRRTVYRWRIEDSRFREQLTSRRRELYDRAQDRFRTLLNTALDLLDKQIGDKYAPTALRAARTLLALAAIGKAAVPESKIGAISKPGNSGSV